MSLSLGSILNTFCNLAGLTPAQSGPYADLARLAADELTARLKPDINPNDHLELLHHAAAGILLYRYTALKAATAPGGKFSAHGVSVDADASKQVAFARELRDELLAAAAHLFAREAVTDGFVFEQVSSGQSGVRL